MKSRYKTTVLILTPFIAVAAMIVIIVLLESMGLSETVVVVVATIVVVGIITAVAGYYFGVTKRRNLVCITTVRKQYPVAYFCSYELAQKMSIIASDKDKVALWKVKNGELALLAEIGKKDVSIEKARVQVAALKKYPGIRLKIDGSEATEVRLALYSDKLRAVHFPLKDNKLNEAIQHLRHGV